MDDQDLSEDALLGGKVRFFQPESGYRVAVDPIFLAAAVPAEAGEQILDVGAGTGAAMLCLAARFPTCRLIGIELQRDLMRIANTNIEANGFSNRAEMIAGDLATLPPRLMAASFDHVMTNPPFLTAEAATASPLRQRADAHVESRLDLAGWLKNSLLMLKNGGSLTLIHRADRLGELLAALDGKIGDMVVYPLWPKADDRPAKRILIQGWKGAKGPLKLARGLVVHEADGRYSQTASAVLRAGKSMPLRPPRQERTPRQERSPRRPQADAQPTHGFAPRSEGQGHA
ncbi:MAG: tRNA1(Val) (adenine(37)-N6)-methyltransferase [Geminicoccaceae bacterium]